MYEQNQMAQNQNLAVKQDYRVDLLNEAFLLRQKDTLCDVTLRVEGLEFRAHRVILAAGSPFFQCLFTNDMKENLAGEVILNEVSALVMDDVLQFIYTGDVSVTHQNAKELAIAANFLLITSLKEVCLGYLQQSLGLSNCFSLRDFAEKYDYKSLKLAATDFICAEFVEVSKMEEFVCLDHEIVAQVISNDNIAISKEEEVFEVVTRWVKHDYEARKENFEELFECLRLVDMSKHYLVKNVQQEDLVTNSFFCTKLLLQAMSAFALSDFSLQNQSKRIPLFTDVIVCCGGYSKVDRGFCKQTFCYIPSQNRWKELQNMTAGRDGHTATVCENLLYIFGNRGSDKTGEVYNASLDTWVPITNLPQDTQHAAAVALTGQIYVLGGASAEKSVFCYYPEANRWSEVAPMNTERHGLCAVAHNGFVYAFGGRNLKTGALGTAEKYCSTSNEWDCIASLTKNRYLASATIVNGKPFVIGGSEGLANHSSGELYNPESNEWVEITQSLVPRKAAGIARLRNKIYLVGGHRGSYSNSFDTMECYDEETNKWTLIGQVPFKSQTFICCGVLRISNELVGEGHSSS